MSGRKKTARVWHREPDGWTVVHIHESVDAAGLGAARGAVTSSGLRMKAGVWLIAGALVTAATAGNAREPHVQSLEVVSGYEYRDAPELIEPHVPWQHANGSSVRVSAGSSRNTIADNEFADIAAAAVTLDGDSTVVRLRSPGDEVRDRGTANRVSRPAGATGSERRATSSGKPNRE